MWRSGAWIQTLYMETVKKSLRHQQSFSPFHDLEQVTNAALKINSISHPPFPLTPPPELT